MKQILRTFALTAMMMVSATTFAQQNNEGMPAPPPGADSTRCGGPDAPGGPQFCPAQQAKMQAERIANELKLTGDQKTAFDTIYCNYQQEIHSMMPPRGGKPGPRPDAAPSDSCSKSNSCCKNDEKSCCKKDKKSKKKSDDKSCCKNDTTANAKPDGKCGSSEECCKKMAELQEKYSKLYSGIGLTDDQIKKIGELNKEMMQHRPGGPRGGGHQMGHGPQKPSNSQQSCCGSSQSE